MGVSKGFICGLEFYGVGYCVNVVGKKLEFFLGYSYFVIFDILEGIEIKVDK